MGQDLKFKGAINWKFTTGPFTNDGVIDIAWVFYSNLKRVEWSPKLLLWLVGKTALYQDSATRVELTASQEERDDENFQSKHQGRIHELAEADEADCLADPALGFKRDAEAMNIVSFLLAHYNNPKPDGSRNEVQIGFDSLFQSMIIGAWTAIEVMLGELHDLAQIGCPRPTSEDREQSWRIMALAKAKGCPVGKQREFTEPNLSTLEGARQAYAVVFSQDSDEIDECLSAVEFEVLYRLRNQFVHEAGIITGSFMKYTKNLHALKGYRQKGQLIELTGDDIPRFIENALNSASKLLMIVDKWLTNHQPKPWKNQLQNWMRFAIFAKGKEEVKTIRTGPANFVKGLEDCRQITGMKFSRLWLEILLFGGFKQ